MLGDLLCVRRLLACLVPLCWYYLGNFLGVEKISFFDLALDILFRPVQLRASSTAVWG